MEMVESFVVYKNSDIVISKKQKNSNSLEVIMNLYRTCYKFFGVLEERG